MKPRKTIYLIAATVFGIILSYIVLAALEIWYLKDAMATGEDIIWYTSFGMATGACALPPYLQYGLLILGIASGYLLGRWWWKIIYVEKLHQSPEKNLK